MRPIFVVLLAVVVFGAVAFGGVTFVKKRAAARRAAADAAAVGRARRTQSVGTIALAPLPVKSPLVERPRLDDFGYPRSYVDQAALRSLLGRAKYAELTAYVEAFEQTFEADFHAEYFVRGVSDAFDSPEPELGPLLDAWVQATPASFAPYLARASHHVAAGFAARGTDWTRNTDATNFAAMNGEFALARTDARHALELAPRLLAALRHLMIIAYVAGPRAEFAELSRRAFELCPACLQPRVVEQNALEPRWGGSYRAMKAAADAAPVALNAKLRLLPGYSEIDRAHGFVRDGQLERALEHVERACQLGEHVDFLDEKGDVLLRLKDVPAALAAFSRALELAPSSAHVMFELADAEVTAKDYRAAYRNLRKALRIQPASSEARRLLPTVVSGLTFVGWEAHKQGREDEALEVLDEASELQTSPELDHRRSAVLTSGFHGTDAELDSLRAAANSAPHDFTPHVRLDYALSTRRAWPPILEMWTAYLADNPEDARAYRERAGTFVQLGRRTEARADAERACVLGSSVGCALEHLL